MSAEDTLDEVLKSYGGKGHMFSKPAVPNQGEEFGTGTLGTPTYPKGPMVYAKPSEVGSVPEPHAKDEEHYEYPAGSDRVANSPVAVTMIPQVGKRPSGFYSKSDEILDEVLAKETGTARLFREADLGGRLKNLGGGQKKDKHAIKPAAERAKIKRNLAQKPGSIGKLAKCACGLGTLCKCATCPEHNPMKKANPAARARDAQIGQNIQSTTPPGAKRVGGVNRDVRAGRQMRRVNEEANVGNLGRNVHVGNGEMASSAHVAGSAMTQWPKKIAKDDNYSNFDPTQEMRGPVVEIQDPAEEQQEMEGVDAALQLLEQAMSALQGVAMMPEHEGFGGEEMGTEEGFAEEMNPESGVPGEMVTEPGQGAEIDQEAAMAPPEGAPGQPPMGEEGAAPGQPMEEGAPGGEAVCPECGKPLDNPQELNAHEAVEHGEGEEKKDMMGGGAIADAGGQPPMPDEDIMDGGAPEVAPPGGSSILAQLVQELSQLLEMQNSGGMTEQKAFDAAMGYMKSRPEIGDGEKEWVARNIVKCYTSVSGLHPGGFAMNGKMEVSKAWEGGKGKKEQCTKCKGKGCQHCDWKGYHMKMMKRGYNECPDCGKASLNVNPAEGTVRCTTKGCGSYGKNPNDQTVGKIDTKATDRTKLFDPGKDKKTTIDDSRDKNSNPPLIIKDVEPMAADAEGGVQKTGPGHKHSDKFERCLGHLKDQGAGAGKQHAVCYTSVGKAGDEEGGWAHAVAFTKEDIHFNFNMQCKTCEAVSKAYSDPMTYFRAMKDSLMRKTLDIGTVHPADVDRFIKEYPAFEKASRSWPQGLDNAANIGGILPTDKAPAASQNR